MRRELVELLKSEVKPAMGCTEPVAVTLAVAKARSIGNHTSIDSMDIEVSANIFKNGLSVGIPKSDEVGILVAAAIGAVGGDPLLELKIYESINEDHIYEGKKILKKINLKIADTDEKIYIRVIINSKVGTQIITSEVIIQGMHNHFAYIKENNNILKPWTPYINNKSGFDISSLTIATIISEVVDGDIEPIEFLLEGLEMNKKIALAGINSKLGMGVGYSTKKSIEKGILGDDLVNTAMYLTAAASDARMSGISLPVMSSNGSGNNGITAILPILAYKMKNDCSDEQIIKALAISHLINCYIKNEIGRLSALCSCGIAAATGSGAAVTWLMGGNINQISGTIQNMIANLSGMICDGAKNSCALKLATAASTGMNAAIFSMSETVVEPLNGIVGRSVEQSIKNLGILSDKGMSITDSVILNIMQDMI